MKKVKCIIVDDEALARDLLDEYISEYQEVDIVAHCSGGREAIKKIDELQADLVLLDVQMPGTDGFDVLENIKTNPFVIFCTAYDKYAIKAFDKNAIDYLLKPIDKARLDLAVKRALKRIEKEETNFVHVIEDLTERTINSYSKNLFVHKSEKLVNLPVDNIVHLEASKDYTIISTKSDQYVSSTGISKLAEKLDPDIFIRIHRSTIINIDRLVEIEKFGNSGLAAKMENGKVFTVSRSYTKAIREKII